MVGILNRFLSGQKVSRLECVHDAVVLPRGKYAPFAGGVYFT